MEVADHQQRDEKQAAAFRRAVWVQVYLPLMVGAILVLALIAFGLAASGRGDTATSGMADVALVALLLPAMLLGVLALAAIALLAFGIVRLIGWIPERTQIVQRIAAQASQQTDRIAGWVAQVVVIPKSAWGSLESLWTRRNGKD